MNRDALFVALYICLLSTHVYAGQWGVTDVFNAPFFELVAYISKPGLLISLVLWVLADIYKVDLSAFAKWILIGLLFSLCGDAFLMFQADHDGFFELGLGSFLMAHIAYIIAFTRTHRRDHEVQLLRQQGWLLMIVVGYGVYFFSKLSPHLGGMTAPVMCYTLAITVMLLMALNRFGKVCNRSFWPITGGAAMFVASDSLLAWNKFVHLLTFSHVLIMLTYGLAQLLIAYGALMQIRDQARQRIGASV
jgi:uncharacterized membrane protein YhhN